MQPPSGADRVSHMAGRPFVSPSTPPPCPRTVSTHTMAHDDATDPLTSLSTLAAFRPDRVLANDREAKTAALLGTIAGQPAIVRLAREPFDAARLASGENTRDVAVTPVVRNDM